MTAPTNRQNARFPLHQRGRPHMTPIPKVGGMDRQTLRDWAHRFNEDGPEGLRNRPGAGRPRQLTDDQMQELAEVVETGPDPAVDGVVRWRRIDLQRVIEKRFGVVYAERTISDLLAWLSVFFISGRPQHPRQDPQVLEAFKKTSLARWRPTYAICPTASHSRSGSRMKPGSAKRTAAPGSGPKPARDRACQPKGGRFSGLLSLLWSRASLL